MHERLIRGRALLARALVLGLLPASPLAAQDHDHEHEHGQEHEHGSSDHHVGLHFTHPIFAESVSPDTKVRLDYTYLDLDADESANELELEGEYAFSRTFSIEAGAHFEADAGELGDTHVIFKFANRALEAAGVLLGYGLEVGLPTGTAHEHEDPSDPNAPEHEADLYELSPFLNAGWRNQIWELIGWTLFEIPVNQEHQENVGAELRYEASLMRHLGGRSALLVEAIGRSGLSGPERTARVLSLAPGVRLQVLPTRPLVLAAGVAFPVTDDRDYETALRVSAFYHF